MRAAIGRLFRHIDRRETEREIEEQMCFHLELLTEALRQQDMSEEEAKDAARKRFGNVERIKAQCVAISSRNNPFLRALKSFLILVLLVGFLVRSFSTELHFARIGHILIVVAVLGRLFLYVRGLNPSSFFSRPETSSPLGLVARTKN